MRVRSLQIAEMCKTSPTFKSFLSDPSVPKKKKAESIIALMTEMKYTDTTKHLFGEYSRPCGSLPTFYILEAFSYLDLLQALWRPTAAWLKPRRWPSCLPRL